MDYGEEIPFEKQPPAGFYDVAEDEEYASQPNFKRLRQQDVVGQRRDDMERVSSDTVCVCVYVCTCMCTVLLGKRVDFDHSVVFADFTSEICMLSNLTWYLVRPMDGLFISRMTSCNHLLCGLGK